MILKYFHENKNTYSSSLKIIKHLCENYAVEKLAEQDSLMDNCLKTFLSGKNKFQQNLTDSSCLGKRGDLNCEVKMINNQKVKTEKIEFEEGNELKVE